MAAVTKLNESWNVGASFNGGTSNYTFRIEVIQESQDTANNTSTVTVKKYVKGNSGNSWYGTACTDAFSSDINDSISYNPARQGSDPNYYGPMRNTEVLYHTKASYVVQHNSDGSRTLSISTTFTNGGNSYAPKTNTKSFEVSLDTIPRASTLTLNKSSVNVNTSSGNAISYTITPASSSFTHTLIWSLGGSNTTISNATSGSLTYTQLLNKLTTSLTGQLSFTLQTYSGSTLVGTTSATASVTIDKTVFKPSITLGNIAVNSSPISGYLVAGYSTAKMTSTTTKSTGAASVSTSYSTSNGTVSPTSSTSTSAVTVTTGALPASTSNYTLTLTSSAVERGSATNSASKTATVYGYSAPTVTLNAYRVASSSSTTRDDSGLYVYVTFSGTLGASVNNQNSIQSTTCTYTGSISGTATNGAHYSLADNQSVTFTATVADKVTSSTLSVTVSAAVYPLDLYDNGAGTVGVGLGGIAEAGKTTSYMPINNVHFGKRATPNGARIDANYKTAFRTESMDTYNNRTSFITPIRNDTANVVGAPQYSSGLACGVWDTNMYLMATYSVDGFYVGGGANDVLNWVNRVYTDGYHPNATNATNAQTTNQWETTATARYPVFVNDNNSSAGVYEELHTSGSFMFKQSTNWASINIGTQAYRSGYLSLYDANSNYYADFTTTRGLTANRTVYIPDASGTILVNNEANYVSLWTGSLTASNAEAYVTRGGYSAFLVVGKAGSDTAFSSVAIPTGLIGTSQTLWQLGSANTYTSFYVSYNSNTVTVKKSNSAGSITAIYGIK